MRRTSAPAACADGPSGPIAVLSRRASQRAARVPTGRGGCYNPGHQRRPLAALARAPCRSAGSRRRRGLVPVAHGDRRSRPPALLCATRRSHALYPGRSPQECRSDRQRDPPWPALAGCDRVERLAKRAIAARWQSESPRRTDYPAIEIASGSGRVGAHVATRMEMWQRAAHRARSAAAGRERMKRVLIAAAVAAIATVATAHGQTLGKAPGYPVEANRRRWPPGDGQADVRPLAAAEEKQQVILVQCGGSGPGCRRRVA